MSIELFGRKERKYLSKCANCGHYENAHVDPTLNRGHSCADCACEGWKSRRKETIVGRRK